MQAPPTARAPIGALAAILVGLPGAIGAQDDRRPARPKQREPMQVVVGVADDDALGVAVARLGDVDKDGVADFAIGAPGASSNGPRSGSGWVYSGADGTLLHLFRGDSRDDELGYSVADAGDVNGDGYADIIAGAPHDDWDEEANKRRDDAGSAQVFSGRDGELLHTFWGPAEGDALGWSVSGAGDLDGDGYDDLLVGAPFHDRTGALDIGLVRVHSGRTGKPRKLLFGHSAGDRFGWALCRMGDVDGDRVHDFVVGIEGRSRLDKQSGMAMLFSGRSCRAKHSVQLGEEHDYFGTSVANVGDIDGDRRDDFAVGAFNATDEEGVRSGAAIVFSGRSGKRLLRLGGRARHDRFGFAIAGAGDRNGDGVPDIAVGMPQTEVEAAGRVLLFSGRRGELLGELTGESIGDRFGSALCSVADRDGDGVPELLVGAPGFQRRGGALVYASGGGGRRSR